MSEKAYLVQVGTTPAPETIVIKVMENGPYEVHGCPPLAQAIIEQNALRQSWRYRAGTPFALTEKAHLCRCGHSRNAPFCDGSHRTAGVDLTETASFAPMLDEATVIEGPSLTLADNKQYCAFGRFCDAGERIWNQVGLGGEDNDRLTERMAHHCPAGRLLVFENETGAPVEPAQPAALGLIEDPALGVSGPIMVTGGIRVESASGESYEIRNRQALCRCGQSANKPFCDGSHASIKYRDGLPLPEEH